MKATRYFSSYIDAYNYYPNGVPSTEIAIVGDSSYILVSSDNTYNGGTTAFFDAGMTNDQIVDTMVDTAYVNGTTYGYSYGYPLGYTNGHLAGYQEGSEQGYEQGYYAGEENGYNIGYDAGYEAGSASASGADFEYINTSSSYCPFNIKCESDDYLTYNQPPKIIIKCKYLEDVSESFVGGYVKGYHNAWTGDYRGDWTKFSIRPDTINNEFTMEFSFEPIYNDPEQEDYVIGYNPIQFKMNLNNKVSFEILSAFNETSQSSNANKAHYKYTLSGNILSLQYGSNFNGQTTMNGVLNGCFHFADFTFFTNKYASSPNVDASGLIMPLTLAANDQTSGKGALEGLFKDSTALIKAPTLSATTLAERCYSSMFYGCTSLNPEKIEIAATTLASDCFENMFYGCSALNCPIVCLGEKTGSYNVMTNAFQNCTSLELVPFMPGVFIGNYVETYSSGEEPFIGCTALKYMPYSNNVGVDCGISDQSTDDPLIALLFGDNSIGAFYNREVKEWYGSYENDAQAWQIAAVNIWKFITDTTAGQDPASIHNDPNNV